MDASVIIPARNAADTLGRCLDALAQQQQLPADFAWEIIVVDDDSADETAAIARAAGARVVSWGRLGKSGTRNAGAMMAQSDILVFTDADCEPSADWLVTMLAPFSDPDVVGLKGAYWSRQTSRVARFIQIEHEERYDLMAQQPQIDFIDTYSAAYRRDIFLANGGFDKQLTYSMVEDQELSFRLAKQGCKMVFVPAARVYHQHLTSPRRYFWRKYWIASWKALILKRHRERLSSDSRTPQTLKLQMALALLLVGLAPLALIVWPAVPIIGVVVGAFVASCVPMLRRIGRRDRAVLPIALPLLLLRAVALALGYVDGTLRWRGKLVDAFLANEPRDLRIKRNREGMPPPNDPPDNQQAGSLYQVGDTVEVIVNERNQTECTGYIHDKVWHFNHQCWYYFLMSEDGKKISKRYAAVDLRRR